MLETKILTRTFTALLYLIAAPLISAVTVTAKLAYLIPLLIKWDSLHLFPHTRQTKTFEEFYQSDSTKHNSSKLISLLYTIHYLEILIYVAVRPPVNRLGLYHVSVSDPRVMRALREQDISSIEGDRDGLRRMVARSNVVVSGCKIPTGTLIEFECYSDAAGSK